MKRFKLFFLTIILVAAIVLTSISAFISGIALKPTVTESEFPFSITYELDGENVTINDVYKVRYEENKKYKSRIYIGEIGNLGEDNTIYTLKTEKNGRIELWTHFYPDYLMGDAEYNYFDEEAFEPRIYYYDAEENEFYDKETLSEQGVKLISFEYPEPIENSMAFSHIIIPESDVVVPTVIIAVLAMLATIIFVKKDNDYISMPINTVTVVFNFIIGFIVMPFFMTFAGLLEAMGDVGDIMNLIIYLLPALAILSITASIGLRRKLYGKSALLVQFISPAVFAVIMFICACLGLL